jgi:hypothetical protein
MPKPRPVVAAAMAAVDGGDKSIIFSQKNRSM